MGLRGFIQRLLGAGPGMGADVTELARRLGVSEQELSACEPRYRTFTIPKRSGGQRTICAPEDGLKVMQRRVLRRVLGRLRCHPCATGFERGHSIVTNALPHTGRAVVVRLDLRDFFGSTTARRVEHYFRAIGWNARAAALLTRLCTWDGCLPQGAPTSPRLSNLLNWRMDARLAAGAEKYGTSYSRYADDITFSADAENAPRVRDLVRLTKAVASEYGYRLHFAKKLRISRRHQRQVVTGLVVNDRPNLPRSVRRRLRAAEHHLRTGRPATLTPAQLAGWDALRSMIAAQSALE